MNTTTTKKCATCKRRKAVMVIRNAYQTSANGKVVCNQRWCFSSQTGGYPAEGRALTPSNPIGATR